MASRNFVVRDITNLKTEAQWLADETYQILPNESVFAVVTKKVTVDNVEQNANYIRMKVNNTTGNRLFKELAYADEYIELKIEQSLADFSGDLNDVVKNLEGRITGVEGTLTGLDGDVSDLLEMMTDLNSTVTQNSKDITTLKSDVATAKTDITTNATNIDTLSGRVDGLDSQVSQIETDIETLTQDSADIQEQVTKNKTDIATANTSITNINTSITNLETKVESIDTTVTDADLSDIKKSIGVHENQITSLREDLTSVELEMASKANLAGANFTGTVTVPTQAASDNSTKAASTAYVQSALAGFSGGIKVVLSSSTPTGMSTGDIWLKQV